MTLKEAIGRYVPRGWLLLHSRWRAGCGLMHRIMRPIGNGLDIHVPLEGHEYLIVAPYMPALTEITAYDAEKDIAF